MGWIYVLDSGIDGEVLDTRLFKIGKAKLLDRRIKQLKIQLPYKVRIEYAYQTCQHDEHEKLLHKAFQNLRINGEWFQLGYEELSLIAEFSDFSGCYEANDGQMIRDLWQLRSLKNSEVYAEAELMNTPQAAARLKFRPINTRPDIPHCLLEIIENGFPEET